MENMVPNLFDFPKQKAAAEPKPVAEAEPITETKPADLALENGQYVMPFAEDEFIIDKDQAPETQEEFVMNRAEFQRQLEVLGLNEEQIKNIDFAYDLAKEGHRHQKREGGMRYFEHVRSAALILMMECKLADPDAIKAALLHDMGEDSPMFGNITGSYEKWKETANYRLGLAFGEDTAKMVIAVTKPSVNNIEFHNKQEAGEFYHHGLEAADARTMLVKMADRLHNLRTLGDTPPEKQLKQLKETREMYLPLFETVLAEYPEEGGHMIAEMEKVMQTIEDQLPEGMMP